MSYLYSATDNAFYPFELRDMYEAAGKWPETGVEVDEEVFTEFISPPPVGKMRVVGDNGRPAWGDIPPPTPEELAVSATAKKTALLAEANDIIAPLKDALDGGYIDDADTPKLSAWQKYRYALTKVDPTKPVWPERPAH